MHRTAALARTPLFQLPCEGLPIDERYRISYERARAIVNFYQLTAEDVLNVSPKYWEFHTDPILTMDGSVGTLLTIHYNLAAGTLAMFARGRPNVQRSLQRMLTFQTSGQYCMSELGHGLDVINLETTATLLPDGSYELHTPNKRAAKFMPPTSPCGTPCEAVVLARLKVGDEDRGIKLFLVPLHDGVNMHKGVVSKTLSPRGGARPIKHALTYFNRVRLAPTALLGDQLRAKDPRAAFFFNISRVIVGSLSMGAFAISAMRIATCVAGRYGLRRTVIDASTGKPRQIATFSSQYLPLMTALSQFFVSQSFSRRAHQLFVSLSNPTQKHFIAAMFKTTVMKHCHDMTRILADRCGAQGMFEANQITVIHNDLRGAAIAEGDTLVICIRFAMELLLGRLEAPPTNNPESLLYRHEQSLLSHLRAMLSASGHRNPETEAILLPQCQGLIEAIGHRMAYDAAVEEGLDQYLIDSYVSHVISVDPSWYSEEAGIPRALQKKKELESATTSFNHLESLLERLDVDSYVTAPMVSDERWDAYERSLQTYSHPGNSMLDTPWLQNLPSALLRGPHQQVARL